jgi:hypothetical protein
VCKVDAKVHLEPRVAVLTLQGPLNHCKTRVKPRFRVPPRQQAPRAEGVRGEETSPIQRILTSPTKCRRMTGSAVIGTEGYLPLADRCICTLAQERNLGGSAEGGGAPGWTGTVVGGSEKGVLFRILFRLSFPISFWTDFERFWELIFDDFQCFVASHFRRRKCIDFPSDFYVFLYHF